MAVLLFEIIDAEKNVTKGFGKWSLLFTFVKFNCVIYEFNVSQNLILCINESPMRRDSLFPISNCRPHIFTKLEQLFLRL